MRFPPPYQTCAIQLNGHQQTYTVAGDPSLPPLLMVHGWASFRGVWQETIASLQERYHCIAIDLLGFGDSDKPVHADYSIPAQARRVLQLAEQLGIERFTLMGHSMGGQIAKYMAATIAQDRIEKVVSVAGVVRGKLMPKVNREIYTGATIGRFFPQIYSIARKYLIHYRPTAYRLFSIWFYEMDSVPFSRWAADRYMAYQPDIHIPVYEAGRAIHSMNLLPYLPKIKAPTLSIFGENDGTVPVEDGRLVKAHVPGSKLVMLKKCGHFPMYEQPVNYLRALHQFLAE